MADAALTQSHYLARPDAPLRDMTVGDALRDAAARWPGSEALVDGHADGTTGRRWTFAALLQDSERLAQALLTRFTPGERIAVWAPNLPEWVLLEFALGLAGLTLVTVNPGYQKRELDYVLRQSRAAGLFMVREFRGNAMAAIASDVVRDLPALREVTDIEDAEALFRMDSASPALPAVSPRDPAQIQYTSGTTGFPKGVLLHHFGLTNNARHYFATAGISEGDTALTLMPLFHTAGCAMSVLGALQAGCRNVLLRQFDPNAALDLIEREQVRCALGVPTMIIAMIEAQDARPRELASLKVLISGGAMVPPELVRDAHATFDCNFLTVYGQTESSPLLTMSRAEDSFEDICNTIGRPIPHTELAIFDPAEDAILPVGAVGEIRVRAYSVMLGYNDDPEATAKTVDAAGWLRTGDLGTIDQRGFVRITGRVKEMIIRGGENLFPAEIENILLEHPDVAEVAVVGVPDAKYGEAVAAFIRPAAGAAFDPGILKAHCRAQIAAQKTPSHWIEVSEWPLTGSGKIQKFELRNQWLAAQQGAQQY